MSANFAVPGMMPVTSPKACVTTPPYDLYPHSLTNSTWIGIDQIGPIMINDGLGGTSSPTVDAARLILEFWPRMYGHRQCVVFDSDTGADGLTIILNPGSWEFVVPAQPLPLDVGWWDWQMKVIDVEDNSTLIYAGGILITP